MTHSAWLWIFWLSSLWLAYIYVGYAVCLWLIARLRPFHHTPPSDFLPKLSVLISARNEEKDIGWKVRETLAWDYPHDNLQVLVASDNSDDGTDQVLAALRDPRFAWVRMDQRSGKNLALERLASLATGDVLLFTDANTHIASEAVKKVVAHFSDPAVGCVTGVEDAEQPNQNAISSAGATYFSYEGWVNTLESSIGSVLVCDGSIFCTRRELFDTLDPQLANDLEQPIKIGARDYKLLYEPQARSLERSTSSPAQEFRRRRRICGQGFLAMWRLRHQLRGVRLWQFLSRKLLRWLTVLPLLALLISTVLLSQSRVFLIVAGVQALLYLLAAIGMFSAALRISPGRVLSIPFYYVLVNVAAFAGVLDTIFGVRYGIWDVASLSRGQEPSTRAEASHA